MSLEDARITVPIKLLDPTVEVPSYAYEGDRLDGSGMNRGGMSNARGRVNNPTGRNQYSREGGYSYAEDMEATKEEIRELSQKMPEEHRRKIERALDELR